jgi:uncharacterized protein YndB with AHSA1/START domain
MADTYTVERSAVVAAPPERVFALVQDFHEWRAWSPWEDLDPDMQRTYAGPPAGVGSSYAWSGNRKAGAGRMEVTRTDPARRVDIALRFDKPFKSSNDLTFGFAPEGEGTRVTWTMVGPRTWMVRVMGIFKSMDSMVGKDFERGLARLKAAAER